MVNMTGKHDDSELNFARAGALQLENDRAKLESELKEWLAILDTNRTGMNEPLVDDDGYPRADIDVYQVRHARNKIICIRNDLKRIMQDMEKHLHALHTLTKLKKADEEPTEVPPAIPFARITAVSENSPAEEAGLRINDLIVAFGSINACNFKSLSDIASVVRYSKNELIKLVIIRKNNSNFVFLKPHEWSGPGLVGCVFASIEDADR